MGETTRFAPADTARVAAEEPLRPRMSLTWKLFFSVAALLFVTLALAVAIATYRAREIAGATIQKALSRAKDSYDNFEEDRYEKLHRALRVVVDNAGFKALVAQGDPDTLANSLREDQASAAGADFLIVTDPRGVSIVRSDRPSYRYDLSRSPLISRALAGSETQGIWYSDGKLYQAVAAPVVSGAEGSATLNGVLVAAFAINDTVAESFRELSNTDVVFLANLARPPRPASLAVAASTLGGRARPFTEAFERTNGLAEGVLDRGMTAGPFDIAASDDDYVGMAWPLRLSSGEIVGAAVAVRSMRTEMAAFRQIEKTLLLVGAAALLLAFAVSFGLARRITGPIARMVEATRRVREGEYEATLPVELNDEVGILARSFRRMLGELKEKAALEKQIAALTMGGEPAPASPAPAVSAPASPADTRLPAPGQLFSGRYEIESELGAGGMGVVYKAHDRVLDDAVAIKVLRKEALAQDATLLDRFKQEIRLARKITHRNVVRTHDFGEAGGLPYISMEYVRGITLKHLLDQNRRLPTAAALRIARQICGGLAAAHAAGVIHRDIKPQNILIEPNGGLKIMDFGIARLTEQKGFTATGLVVGTPDYMSPEQARGGTLDARSDIYSAGVVFYELFTGSLPFEGDSALGVVLKHIQEEPPPPSSANPQVDPRIARIILKAMAKDPAERYQHMGDLLGDLSEVTV